MIGFLFFVSLAIGSGNCAKILYLAALPAISHFQMMEPLMKALAEKGHQVTVLSHYPQKVKIANYTDIDLRDLFPAIRFDFEPRTFLQDMSFVFPNGLESCNKFFSSEKIQNFLNSESHFDLIFMEGLESDCYLGLVLKYKCPFIVVSFLVLPLWQSDWIYNPTQPSYIPDIIFRLYGSMNFLQRLQNLGSHLYSRWLYWMYNVRPSIGCIKNHFGIDVENMDNVKANLSMVFMNSFHGVTGIRPILPNIIELGGLHLKPAKPIPKDIKKFLDEATNGAIIMSMGSVVKSHTLNNEIKEGILRVFSKLKQRVLWKWETDFPNPPPNLKTIRWMPQADILGHPNVKAFIAHGGIHGLFEAINYGVPIVGIPLFGDQQGNLKSLEHRGVAVVIDYVDLGEETLSYAISEILNNESYAINAKKLSQQFHDQPQTPLEKALFWTEYVLRHKGAPVFQNSATRLSWFQYLMIDVILASFILIFIFIFILCNILKLIKRILFK